MGIKLKDAISDPSRALKSTRFLLRDSQPAEKARESASKFLKWSHADRMQRKKEGKQSKLRLQEVPSELIPVMRMINLLQGLCSQMDQNIPIMKVGDSTFRSLHVDTTASLYYICAGMVGKSEIKYSDE